MMDVFLICAMMYSYFDILSPECFCIHTHQDVVE